MTKDRRDAWCFNASKSGLAANMSSMIGFYNEEVARFQKAHGGLDKKAKEATVDDFADSDSKRISWTSSLKQDLVGNRCLTFDKDCLVPSVYRPFSQQWAYYDGKLNHRVGQLPHIFPDAEAENRMIMVKQRWTGDGQLALMVDRVAELQTDGGAQCFPLYLYDGNEPASDEDADRPDGRKKQTALFEDENGDLSEAAAKQAYSPRYQRRDAVTDSGLAHFQAAYPGETLNKEDVFYYVYGLLHSPDYRERYADNLSKELPRIPCVKTAADFWAFSQAGRKLADLHLNYETVEPYPVTVNTGGKNLTDADYRVEKMKYGKKGKDKDLTTLHYNSKITLSGIPLEAYEYVVNGKPALDWVVERQCVKTDKDSGIVNDANDWAIETMGNPRYPLELFQRVITVSLETMKIVKGLPALDI